MKTVLLLSALLLTSIAQSQWLEKHSDEYQYYNTICFIDSLNGWIGGYYYSGDSFILKTTNGGESWNTSIIGGNPQSICFADNSIGFCGTYDGIYKTSDGGNSWVLNYQDSLHYNSIQFIDGNNGWATGYNSDSYLLKTENGGETWNKYFIANGIRDPRIKMINELTGFLISLDDNFIRKTSDGGETWFVINNEPYDNQLFDLSFSDSYNGFICGINNFLHTDDGGDNWVEKYIPISFCTNIHSQGNHIWVAGFGIEYSAIVYSDNWGETWTPLLVEESKVINDIFFYDVNIGWFCSNFFNEAPLYNGFIYKTEGDWIGNIDSPLTPQQIFPANNSILEEISLSFEWEKHDYSLYRLQISEDPLFTNFFVFTNSTEDTLFIGDNLYIQNEPLVSLLKNKTYYWRVRSENKMGVSDWSDTWSFTISSSIEVKNENVPEEFNLYQNYPNPFNPTTTITYKLSEEGFINLSVYDVLGKEVVSLVNENQSAGEYKINFDAAGLSSGIYFCQLKQGDNIQAKKLILQK